MNFPLFLRVEKLFPRGWGFWLRCSARTTPLPPPPWTDYCFFFLPLFLFPPLARWGSEGDGPLSPLPGRVLPSFKTKFVPHDVSSPPLLGGGGRAGLPFFLPPPLFLSRKERRALLELIGGDKGRRAFLFSILWNFSFFPPFFADEGRRPGHFGFDGDAWTALPLRLGKRFPPSLFSSLREGVPPGSGQPRSRYFPPVIERSPPPPLFFFSPPANNGSHLAWTCSGGGGSSLSSFLRAAEVDLCPPFLSLQAKYFFYLRHSRSEPILSLKIMFSPPPLPLRETWFSGMERGEPLLPICMGNSPPFFFFLLKIREPLHFRSTKSTVLFLFFFSRGVNGPFFSSRERPFLLEGRWRPLFPGALWNLPLSPPPLS